MNNKINNIILELYAEDRTIVDDDAALISAVWEKLGWDYNCSVYWNMSRLPRSESITRRRRELHVAGKINYSKDALKSRTEAFKNERDIHSSFLN